MRGRALGWTTPIAAGIVALVELTRLPADAHGGDPGRLLAALAQLARSAFTQFLWPSVLLLLAAAAISFAPRRPRATRALLALLGVAESALAREVAIEYSPFAWNAAITIGFVLVAIAFGGALLWLASQRAKEHRRATLLFGAALSAIAIAILRAHYLVFVGLYPTAHACVLQIAFVSLALGLAFFFSALPERTRAHRVVFAAIAPLAILALFDLPASAWAKPYVVAYTELGRSAGVARALEREGRYLLPRSLPPARTASALRPDRDGLERFAAHANLPAMDLDLAEHDVLFVLSDATRWDRTSLAGTDGVTPNLAALEREGAYVFERAYSPSNGTFPSLASMLAMTPVSFAELDVRDRFWRGRLREERTTAIEAMRAAGRRTFWIGHDHSGCFTNHIRGLDQGFEHVDRVTDGLHADARIASRAIRAIRAHRRRNERYFGLVFFGSPHDEYLAHDPGAPAETDLDRYDQELAFVDQQIGRLIAALRTMRALDRTIVIVLGDHGEAFGEHGQKFHLSSMHDEQIHVPFVAWTGGGGRRMPLPTSASYVLPWLLLRGSDGERRVAREVIETDIGPLMRELDGAVLSEMIGPRMQEAALIWDDHTVLYDVLADLARIYDSHGDPGQERDLREARPDLLGDYLPFVRRYRAARFSGRRFRFIESEP
jgi:arylsulfatase A-like enzyme